MLALTVMINDACLCIMHFNQNYKIMAEIAKQYISFFCTVVKCKTIKLKSKLKKRILRSIAGMNKLKKDR